MPIFGENVPVKGHNDNQLKQMPRKLITIPAKDKVPKNSKISDVRETKSRIVRDWWPCIITLTEINASLMLTTNINTWDQLINGETGIKDTRDKRIDIKEIDVGTIYLELDNKCTGNEWK